MGLSKKPIQVGKPQGWEGRLAPANIERHSTSRGKPPFLTCKAGNVGSCRQNAPRRNGIGFAALLLIAILLVSSINASARSILDEYEGRAITSIEITFEGSPSDPAAEAEFLSIIKILPNTQFSAVAVRDSLQALFDSERVANARVEVLDAGASNSGPIRVRFVIQRQVQIGDVKFEIATAMGVPITQDELRARLNLSQPGTRLSKQIVSRNADELQAYLRDRGYFNATVEAAEELDTSGTRASSSIGARR